MLGFVTDVTEIGLILSCLNIAYSASSEIINLILNLDEYI